FPTRRSSDLILSCVCDRSNSVKSASSRPSPLAAACAAAVAASGAAFIPSEAARADAVFSASKAAVKNPVAWCRILTASPPASLPPQNDQRRRSHFQIRVVAGVGAARVHGRASAPPVRKTASKERLLPRALVRFPRRTLR